MFSFIINLVKLRSVDELVDVLKKGKMFSKEKVISESEFNNSVVCILSLTWAYKVQSRAQDADIIATSMIMSLKCPLSTLRMVLPCRSTICSHNQCFDAASFLQLQEQGPTWTCPICNKIISFEALVVDE